MDRICRDTELCEATSSAWGEGDLGAACMLATLSSCDVEDFVGAAALATVSICGNGDLSGAGVALTTVSACGTGDFGGVGLALLSTSGDLEGVRGALLICWLELDTCSSHKTCSSLLGVGLTSTDLVFMVDVVVAGTAPLLSSLMATGTAFGSGALIFALLTITEDCSDCSGPFRTWGVFSELDEDAKDEPTVASAAAFFSKWALSSSLPSISF